MLDLFHLHVNILTVGIVYQTMFDLHSLCIHLNITLTVVTL